MVDNQCCCCGAPLTSGADALGAGEGVSGTGGGTSSCTSRVQSDATVVRERDAASSMCVFDGGADPYGFSLHSAVVCDVEVGCLVQEPAGCLDVAGLASELAADAGFFALPALPAAAEEAAAVDTMPNCCGCWTSYRMSRLRAVSGANMSILPLATALHLRWYSRTTLSDMPSIGK